MIGIDNLSQIRSVGGHGAENDTAVMTAVLEPLAKLAQRRRIAVVVLHHANARGELRGSSAIRQHCDAVFEIVRESPANESPVTITRTKDRTGEALESVTYRLRDDDALGVRQRRVIAELVGAEPTEVERPNKAAAAAEPGDLSDRQSMILEVVRASPGTGINAVGRAIKERTGKNPSMRDVTKDLEFLVEDGQLRRDAAKKYWPVDGD
jgi:hypothetical protein